MPLLDRDRLARPRNERGRAVCGRCVRQSERRSVGFCSVPTRTRIPGQGCRRRPGIARLSVREPRYSPRLADCVRTPPRGTPVPVLAGGRIDRHRPARQRRRPGLGGARLPHLPAGCPQAQTGDHQQGAPRRRRPLHSSRARAVQGGAGRGPRHRSPRARRTRALPASSQGFSLAPRPGPRAGPVLRRRPDRRDRRDRPRRRAPGASRPRQPAAARRATPATIRSASTRRGSARGRRRSRSRGARSSSSP